LQNDVYLVQSLVLKLSAHIHDVQTRVSDLVMRKEKVVEEMVPKYDKLKNYIVELEDHLAEAQLHSMRVVKQQRGTRILSCIFLKYLFLVLCTSSANY
jgi:hypothetical protein